MTLRRFSFANLLLLAVLLASPPKLFAQAPRVKPAEPTLRPTTPPPAAPAPDDLLLPPSGPRLTAVPIRLKLAATDPVPSSSAPTAFGITTLEVRTPVSNLWFGLTDLSLPLAPATFRESPSSLLDTLSSSTPVLTYRLKF